MTWIDRLVNVMPDSPQGVGVWLMAAGLSGTLIACPLQDLPLSVGSLLIFLAGAYGPLIHDLKQSRNIRRRVITVSEVRREDAQVAAYFQEKVRESVSVNFHETGATEECPPRHRLH